MFEDDEEFYQVQDPCPDRFSETTTEGERSVKLLQQAADDPLFVNLANFHNGGAHAEANQNLIRIRKSISRGAVADAAADPNRSAAKRALHGSAERPENPPRTAYRQQRVNFRMVSNNNGQRRAGDNLDLGLLAPALASQKRTSSDSPTKRRRVLRKKPSPDKKKDSFNEYPQQQQSFQQSIVAAVGSDMRFLADDNSPTKYGQQQQQALPPGFSFSSMAGQVQQQQPSANMHGSTRGSVDGSFMGVKPMLQFMGPN